MADIGEVNAKQGLVALVCDFMPDVRCPCRKSAYIGLFLLLPRPNAGGVMLLIVLAILEDF